MRSTAAPGRRAVGASTPPVPEPNPTAKEPLMTNPATATPTPGRTGPPWTAEGTVFFYGGFLSNFAPTPGLRLPFGYHGHHENDKVRWLDGRALVSGVQGHLAPAVRPHPHLRDRRDRQARGPPDPVASRLGARQVPGDAVRAARQVRAGALPRRRCCSPTRARSPKTAPATSSGAPATPTAATAGRTCSGSR